MHKSADTRNHPTYKAPHLLPAGWFTATATAARLSLTMYALTEKSLPVGLRLPKLSYTVTVKPRATPAVAMLRPNPFALLLAKQPLAAMTCHYVRGSSTSSSGSSSISNSSGSSSSSSRSDANVCAGELPSCSLWRQHCSTKRHLPHRASQRGSCRSSSFACIHTAADNTGPRTGDKNKHPHNLQMSHETRAQLTLSSQPSPQSPGKHEGD